MWVIEDPAVIYVGECFAYVLLSKEAKIYNGKKTTSLTSGAGETAQPLVKE